MNAHGSPNTLWTMTKPAAKLHAWFVISYEIRSVLLAHASFTMRKYLPTYYVLEPSHIIFYSHPESFLDSWDQRKIPAAGSELERLPVSQ